MNSTKYMQRTAANNTKDESMVQCLHRRCKGRNTFVWFGVQASLKASCNFQLLRNKQPAHTKILAKGMKFKINKKNGGL